MPFWLEPKWQTFVFENPADTLGIGLKCCPLKGLKGAAFRSKGDWKKGNIIKIIIDNIFVFPNPVTTQKTIVIINYN